MANVVRKGAFKAGTPRHYSDLGHVSQYYKGQIGQRRSLPPARRNPWLGFVAIPNGKLSMAAERCAGALAAQAKGDKKYRWVDTDKQVEKWCEDKVDDVSERCAEALAAKDANKGNYRLKDVDRQIATWCSEEEAVKAAASGVYTPASPAEVVEELYWNEDQVVASGQNFVDTEEDKKSLVLPIAAGVLALGVIVIGVIATR